MTSKPTAAEVLASLSYTGLSGGMGESLPRITILQWEGEPYFEKIKEALNILDGMERSAGVLGRCPHCNELIGIKAKGGDNG